MQYIHSPYMRNVFNRVTAIESMSIVEPLARRE